MQSDGLVSITAAWVKETLEGAEAGHDWWHIQRVWNNAITLAKGEDADLFIVEMAALLHDIADSKFHNGNEEIGPQKALEFLNTLHVPEETTHRIVDIIRNISFKGGHGVTPDSIEFKIVQDADRLDAMGAIGIDRAFHYGGFKNRELYNPEVPPRPGMSKEEYKSSTAPTINHFYEKLLLLKDRMNTRTGKMMAEERHRFMEQYLQQFYSEWEGNASNAQTSAENQ